jgi:hypothetical protein
MSLDIPSSPPSEVTSAEDAVTWYKAQYEQLEMELAEFRDSSRELEQELEKDIERQRSRSEFCKKRPKRSVLRSRSGRYVMRPLPPSFRQPQSPCASILTDLACV